MDDLLTRVEDPVARSEVQLLQAEVAALTSENSTLKQAFRRIQALGPITSELAVHRVESLEELVRRIEHRQRPTGLDFTAEERSAVRRFLASLHREGYSVDPSSDELIARTGRRVAKGDFVRALRKLVEPPKGPPDDTATQVSVVSQRRSVPRTSQERRGP
jgi:hypothetical protein